MKKQFLALIGGVMVAGLAMAAEVVGNNEAVVIQKAAVKSSTNYQFLCVPVAPLDITGANTGKLTLAGVLPPELYYTSPDEPTTVTIGTTSYQVVLDDDDVTKKWVTVTEIPQNADGTVLPAGTIFWLNTTKTDATVFCGQATEAVKVTDVTGIVACGNTSSEAKTLSELIDEPTPNSWVYVIQKDKTDYKQYQYDGTKWCTSNAIGIPIEFTGKIAAGEAFYYLKAQAK